MPHMHSRHRLNHVACIVHAQSLQRSKPTTNVTLLSVLASIAGSLWNAGCAVRIIVVIAVANVDAPIAAERHGRGIHWVVAGAAPEATHQHRRRPTSCEHTSTTDHESQVTQLTHASCGHYRKACSNIPVGCTIAVAYCNARSVPTAIQMQGAHTQTSAMLCLLYVLPIWHPQSGIRPAVRHNRQRAATGVAGGSRAGQDAPVNGKKREAAADIHSRGQRQAT